MKKLFFLLPVFLLADVNPFQAGNLNAPNPYGLTPQEKAILANKDAIKKNSQKIESLKEKIEKLNSLMTQKFVQYDQTVSDMNDKLSSFDTILSEIDSTKQKVDELKKNLKDANVTQMQEKIADLEKKVDELSAQQTALKKTIDEIIRIQNQNYQHLSISIQKILRELEGSSAEKLTPSSAFEKAKKYFFAKKYDKAKDLFLYALDQNHLPATSAFYLGEIAFNKGEYAQALAYYKKSISLYPKKTSFTDKLLYHTGISFMKLNQKQGAKLTFEKLIHDFPKSKYAKLAKKELEKL